MKSKYIFTTRREAARKLTSLNWQRIADSCFGEWVFAHPKISYRRLIVGLKAHKWEIQNWRQI